MDNSLIHQETQHITYSVQIPGGAYITRKLKEGETVSIGSDDTADLRLDSPGIAGMHCLLTFEEGLVCIKDCYSPSGTFVDGQRVQDVQVSGGCLIRLSEVEIEIKNSNRISPTLREQISPTVPVGMETAHSDQDVSLADFIHEHEDVVDKDDETVDLQVSDPISEVLEETHDLTDRNLQLMNEIEELRSENQVLNERLKFVPKTLDSSRDIDPLQVEMLDLMKQEIEELQQELEKRNSHDFSDVLSFESVNHEQLPSRQEVEQVVDRLEELLDELSQKDEQIQVLQDLVLSSDTANQAEQEEREQLTNWLGEFEQRFEILSGEWQAENNHLKCQVEYLEEERSKALTALSTETDSVKAEALKRLTDSLREDLSARTSEVQNLKVEIHELKSKLEEAEHSSPREEEIRLSRERAEIARMRHDLEVRIQKAQFSEQESSAVEQKLKSLTNQLREPKRTEKEITSLSGRFLSLWGRLNG